MSSLTKVRITLKDPQGRVLAKHPFIVKLLHADIVGVTTVDKPVFSQTGLNGTVILELKPSEYIYSLEYSIRGQRVPAILKFKVPVSADIINIEDIYIDTNYETNDVLALVNELKAIKATVLQMMQEHPDLVTRVNHVANALDNLVSTVTNQGDGIDEILTRLSALDMATDSLIAITDDLVRDKADKYLFTELSTKLDNEVTRITGLINNIVTDLQADKLDLANFKLYIAAKFASIDTDLFKIKSDIVDLKTGQIDEGVFKKTITDELTVKWQNDIKGYDNEVQASLKDIHSVIVTSDTALAQRIETTEAKVNDNEASITEIKTTYVTKDRAVATVEESLRAKWTGDAADMLDKLQIGGRNLLKLSEAPRALASDVLDTLNAYNIETGYLSSITVYTLSGFIRVTDNVLGVEIGFKNVVDAGDDRLSGNLTGLVVGEWTPVKYTFTTGIASQQGYVTVIHKGSTDAALATVEAKLMKLEIGTKSTDWTPAVTDIDDKITIVEAGLDSFKRVQASKDLAMTERVDNAFSAINDNEASIKSIETTYAKHDEVGAIAKTRLEAEWRGYTDSEINSVVIGGKNYLDDGYFNKGYWQFYGDNLVTGRSAGGKLSMDSQTTSGIGEWYLSSLKSKTIGNLASNTKYTISFTGFGSSQYGFMQVNVILRSKQNGVFVTKANLVFNVEDLNTRHVRQLSTGNLNNSEEIQLVFQIKNAIGSVWISEAQLELGSKATDWTLAPSDYLDEIAVTRASLDEFKQVQASANEALAERMMTAETQLGVTKGKVTSLESSVSTVQGTVTTIQQTMNSNYKDTTAKYNSLANTVASNQSSTVTSLTELSSRIDNISFNMIIPGKVVNGYIDLTNGNRVVNTASRASDFMDVYTQTTYIIKSEGGAIANVRLAWYNASKAFLSSVNIGTVDGAKTYVAPTNALYARVSWAYADGKNLSVKEVSTAGQVAADLESFKQVQTNKNSAFTNSISSQQTAIDNNSSAINNITNTYAKTDEVGVIAKTALQSTWQADAQAKIDAIKLGGRNYLLNSDTTKYITFNNAWNSSLYSSVDMMGHKGELTLTVTLNFATATTEPLSAWFQALGGGTSTVNIIYNSTIPAGTVGLYTVTGTIVKEITSSAAVVIAFRSIGTAQAYTASIVKIKLESGNKSTDWSPAPEEAKAEITSLNSSINSLSQTVSNNQTTTATQIGQLTSNVSSIQTITDRAEGYVENGILYVPSPLGASYSGAAGSNAGAIRISLPTNPVPAMVRFTVDIFNYAANTSNSYEISGYVNNTASPWLQNTAICTGAANRAFPVRFGTDDTGKACVWIGNLDSTWSYCRVKVRDLTVGFANLNKELWRQGWSITFVTAYNTVTATVNPFNGDKAAADVSASLDSFKTTQADRDAAQTLSIDNAVSRVGTLEGSVSNVTSTYAKKTEVGALAKTALQSTWEGYTNSAVSGVRTDLTKAEANITTMQTTMASQGSAIAAQETTLKAAINNASKGSAFVSDFKDPSVWYSHYDTNISSNFKSNITSSPSNPYAYYSGIGNDFNYSTQVVNIEKGHKYKFSAWFYNAAGNGSFGFNWKRQGALNNYAASNVVVPNGGGWQYKEVVVTEAVLGDWAIQPGFYINHTGTTGHGYIALYKFEDITLEESVKAQWTVTTEAVGTRKAVAGLSLGVDGNTGESTFLVKANKFEIADSNNAIKAAFINNGLNPELVLDGSLSAQKVRIGIGANLIPDPFWEAGLSGMWLLGGTVATITLRERANSLVPSTCPSTRVVRYAPASGTASYSMFSHIESYLREAGGIPVIAGEQYKLSIDLIKAASPVTTGTLEVRVYYYLQTGSTSYVTPIAQVLGNMTGAVWNTLSATVAVPANAVKMRVYVYGNSITGVMEWCNLAIMKMVDGSLVVNGSITANEIAANSVNASHIVAKVALDSPVINAGTLNGGSANFGNGNCIIDKNGNLYAKSGTFEGTVKADKIEGDVLTLTPFVNKSVSKPALPYDTTVVLMGAEVVSGNYYQSPNLPTPPNTVAVFKLNDTVVKNVVAKPALITTVYDSSESAMRAIYAATRVNVIFSIDVPANTPINISYNNNVTGELQMFISRKG